MLMRVFILLITSLSFVGCANYWTRKSCEKINWHDHGYKVAMKGKRLTGDEMMTKCQKAEAEVSFGDADTGWKAGMQKYCSVEGALEKGRNGEAYSLDFCDKTKNSKTHLAYKKGINEFCQADKGYGYGASGEEYQNVCPQDLEAAWMPEYKRGRKVYLQGEINSKRSSISQIDDEVIDYENERRDLLNRIALLPGGRVATTERQYDPDTKTYKEVTRVAEDEATKDQRRQLQWDLDSVSSKIKNARDRQKNLRAEIRDLEKEMHALN